MKKLFTLLTMLVICISGMWADSYSIATTPTQVTSITSGKFYVINGIDQSTSNKHYLFDNGTKVTSNNPQTLPTNDAGKFIWKIVGNTTDGYTLQNLQTGKYMSLGSSSGSQISSSSTSQTNGIYFGDGNYATIRNSNDQAIDVGWNGSNPTTWSGSTTPSGSRRLQIYEIEVICDIFADDDYNYTKWHLNYFDRNLDASEIPADVSTVAAQSGVEGDDISCKKGYLNFSSSGNHTVTFQWTGGNMRLDILGVDICDESLTVVASDYHAGFTGGNKSNNVYTVNIPSSGNYLVRYFTKMPSSSGNTTNGTITWDPSVSSSDCYTYVLGGTANVSDLPEIVGKTRKSVKVIAGGLLTIDDDDFNLCSVQGAGNVVLDVNTSLTGGKSTSATGKLTISDGVILTIGEHQDQTNSIASFSSIDLAGQIKNNNSTLTLNNVTVPEGKNGVIFSKDMGGTADGFLLDGTTTVNGNLFVCNRLNFQMKVNELAGNGTWTINGTTSDDYSAGTSSSENATINVWNSPDFTGTIQGNNSNASVIINGTLANCTFMANHGSPKLAEGAILDDVILDGSKRISTTGNVTIRDLAGNNLSNTTNNYALVGTGTLNLEGDCDFTKKSDNSDCGCANIGCRNGSSIVIKSGANVKAAKISYDTGDNAAITVEGTLTATKLHGPVTLAEGSVTTLSDATPFNEGAVTVSGNATLNLSAANITLNQPITIASGKTLTIDGGESNATVTLNSLTNNGTVNFNNVTVTLNRSERDLSGYSFTNCTATLQFVETGAEYAAGGFTITNIPSGVTVKVKKYGATDYETVTPTDGTVTISHSVEVSGSAAWLDYTFNLSTKDKNTGTSGNVIKNAGNAGESDNNLTLDSNNGYQYTPSNSYNDDGTLKVMSTPWRNITWPTNYTVAVAGNVPDIENGCLVAFGTHDGGYLAILRGDANNKILLVKGKGNNHFETISTMTAANATELSHLVVFTKNGNTFTVYLDGVQKTQVTYSETLGGGFQIGSIHGGITNTGIERVTYITDETKKAKVFAKGIRVYDYVISDDQMSQLTEEFPYTSFGGKYTRTITEDSNLSATGAWLNANTQGNVDIPVNAVVDEVIYYPDVEITTDAASTLTVNADMDTENIKFDGAGKLTIASDGTHHINISGSVTANGPVSVKYGEIDLTAVPVSIGESGSVEFDFSASDFSGVTTSTYYLIIGNTSDYGNKVTGVYPSDIYHTFTITYNSTTNSYYLTVGPSVAFFQQRAINLVKPYYDGRYVGTGLGKYTISLGETSYAEMADFRTAVMSWASLEDCIDPTIIINQPTSAFYRIKSGDKYLQDARKSDSATQRTLTDAAGANSAETIFYLDNNKFIGYKTGYGFGFSVCQTQDTEQLNTQLFTESAEMGKYTIQSQRGTCESASYNEGYWGVSGSELSREADAASGACWTLEEVTSLPLTLAANSYTSFSAPVAVTIPDGCHAYVATSTPGDSYITMTAVTGNVPANQGLIIGTDATANPTFAIYSGSSEDLVDCSGNMLVANVAASNVNKANNYFFGKVDGNDNYVFAKISGTGTRTLGGHKAYLHYEKGTNARMAIIWEGDDPTGIEGLQNESVEMKDGKYYQNGKVVVVRNGVKYNVAGQIIK